MPPAPASEVLRPLDASRRFAAILRLVRLPNTLTAFADVLAGAALAGLDPLSPRVLAAGAGSALLYGGGVALNDVLDVEKDRLAHPERPIPSGLVSKAVAAAISAVLIAAGAATALLGSSLHLMTTAALIAAILAYDTLPGDRPWTGSALMAACRGANLLRGATLAGAVALTSPPAMAAAAHALLVFGITFVSALEERPRPGARLRAALAVFLVPYLVPGSLARHTAGFVAPAALAAGLALAAWVTLPGWRPPPRPILVVKRAVFTLVLVDALYVLASGRPAAAAATAALYPLMLVLAAAIRQRGS